MHRGYAATLRAAARFAFVAALVVVVAISSLRWGGYWQGRGPLLGFVMAVVIAAVVGGARAALVATALGGLAMDWLFLRTVGALVVEHPADRFVVVVLLALGAVVVAATALEERREARQNALGERRRRRIEATEVELAYQVRDVTAQARASAEREALLASERAARASAERASRAKDEFVATISHELRTPLNAIVGFAHLARRPGQSAEQIARALDVIERNAALLTQIISDLLDVSRIVTGKMGLTLAPVELGPLLDAALIAVAAAAEIKGVALRADVGAPSAFVRADASRLQQVVWNLVSNAIKFTPRGGRVDVSLAAREGAFEIVVSDTGQGMDPAFVPCVFERFRQADASASRRHGGLGLGLSIVKHLVDLHGGEVRAASDGPGLGSRFTVTLPACPTGAAEAAARASPDPSRLAGACVLVVDDEPDAKDLVRRLLEEQGARVVLASSAGEALASLEEGVPDVMISDIGMPGMDGYELIRLVRSVSPGRHLPAVALTAYARPEDLARVLRAGYQAHLSKPVQPRELLATVARLAHTGAL
jgi:signal transduction histidine kinase/CheY-like chemotaxis protein